MWSGCPAEPVAPARPGSGSITGQLRDPLHLNTSNCQVLHLKKKKKNHCFRGAAHILLLPLLRNESRGTFLGHGEKYLICSVVTKQASQCVQKKSLPSARTCSGSFSVGRGLPTCGASRSVLGTGPERYRQSTSRLEKSNKKD